MFTLIWGRGNHFDSYFFQMGWFNHQLDLNDDSYGHMFLFETYFWLWIYGDSTSNFNMSIFFGHVFVQYTIICEHIMHSI